MILTKKEKIVKLLKEGKTSKEIAEMFGCSTSYVNMINRERLYTESNKIPYPVYKYNNKYNVIKKERD